LAPQHALAQSGGAANNLTAINARLTALEAAVAAETAARLAAEAALQNSITAEANARTSADTALLAQIDKLKGNIVPGDLVGTYAVHFVATAMDGPLPNQLTSYTITGTATLAADNTGSATFTAGGIAWTEGTPLENWARQEVGGVIEFDFTWSYSDGTLCTESDNDFGDGCSDVVAGGQVIVTAQGGAPSNNQLMVIWTRRP